MSYKDLIDDEGYKVKLIWVKPTKSWIGRYQRWVNLKGLELPCRRLRKVKKF